MVSRHELNQRQQEQMMEGFLITARRYGIPPEKVVLFLISSTGEGKYWREFLANDCGTTEDAVGALAQKVGETLRKGNSAINLDSDIA